MYPLGGSIFAPQEVALVSNGPFTPHSETIYGLFQLNFGVLLQEDLPKKASPSTKPESTALPEVDRVKY